MKSIEELLQNLGRPEVLEFGLVTHRLPSVNIGGKFEPVDDEAPSTSAVLDMLARMGGSAYVGQLNERPLQWTARLEGVGLVAIAAIMRNEVVQARFTLARRETAPTSTAKISATQPIIVSPSSGAQKAASATQPVSLSTTQSLTSPAGASGAPSPGTSSGQPLAPSGAHLADTAPSLSPAPTASAASSSRIAAAAASAALASPTAAVPTAPNATATSSTSGSVPPPGTSTPSGRPGRMVTWEDDDEPTVQTLSPSLRKRASDEAARAAAARVDSASPASKRSDSEAPPSGATTSDMRDDAANARAAASDSGTRRVAGEAAPLPRVDGTLDALLAHAEAADADANDIHVIAGRPLLLRVATELVPRTQPIAAEQVERIVREIVPAELRAILDDEGACYFAMNHPHYGRFRVNVSRQRTGFKLGMRAIPRDVPTLEALGLPDGVNRVAKIAQGLVLVAGLAGQGKTTTLAAMVDLLNRDTAGHILTIEDPIEFVFAKKRALVSQREVRTHVRSTVDGIAESTRQDVDVLVIGEICERDVLEATLDACERGHLVLAAVTAPSAPRAIERLVELVPQSARQETRLRLSQALRLVIGQRLLPGADCARLHAAVEVLPASIAVCTQIRNGRPIEVPRRDRTHALAPASASASAPALARAHGFGAARLEDSLAELVRAGKVTPDVARSHGALGLELDMTDFTGGARASIKG